VSGEITTDDGKLIYRAELIEAKQGKPALASPPARLAALAALAS